MGRRRARPARERGLALIALMTILAIGAAYLLMSRVTAAAAASRLSQRNDDGLVLARDALIAYAVARQPDGANPNRRPGELPCPDRDDDGYAQSSCSAGELGRVPWRSLGIPPPTDAGGELIWYAIAGPFRTASAKINSGTRGNLLVYGQDGVAVQADDAVLVLFAPGPALGAQRRSTETALCSYDAVVKPASHCPSNYLDAYEPASPHPLRDNAREAGPFVAGSEQAGFNDRLLVVRTEEFIARLERRVGLELMGWLAQYYAASGGRLPYPAAPGDAACIDGDETTLCKSSATVCAGRFPESAVDGFEPEWSPPLTSPARAWFIDNEWASVLTYAAGTSALFGAPPGCGPVLTVDAVAHAGAVILPGARPAAATWPSLNLSSYLENGANADAWSGTPDALSFVTPTASNDRLFRFQ